MRSCRRRFVPLDKKETAGATRRMVSYLKQPETARVMLSVMFITSLAGCAPGSTWSMLRLIVSSSLTRRLLSWYSVYPAFFSESRVSISAVSALAERDAILQEPQFFHPLSENLSGDHINHHPWTFCCYPFAAVWCTFSFRACQYTAAHPTVFLYAVFVDGWVTY